MQWVLKETIGMNSDVFISRQKKESDIEKGFRF